jgi:hypothetical protein
MSWASIIQPPDPTGQGGEDPRHGRDQPDLAESASDPPPAVSDIDVTTVGMTASDGTAKLQIITGTATAPNVGGRDTNIAVNFPTPFLANPLWVGITPRFGGTVSAFGNAPIPRVSALSATGFTAAFTAGELDDSNAGFNFNGAIAFDWVAIGLVTP